LFTQCIHMIHSKDDARISDYGSILAQKYENQPIDYWCKTRADSVSSPLSPQ